MPHTSVVDADGMAAGLWVGPTFCNFLGGSVEIGLFFTGDIAGRLAGTVSCGFNCVAEREVDCTELEETRLVADVEQDSRVLGWQY
jgi:hypothetical protein